MSDNIPATTLPWQNEKRRQRGEHMAELAEPTKKAQDVLSALKSGIIGDTPGEMAFNAATLGAWPLKAARPVLGGLAALSASDDANAGLLLGPKGALRGGMTKLYDLLMREKDAANAIGGGARLTQATGKPKIWTGMELEPRTFLPSNKLQVVGMPKEGGNMYLTDMLKGIPEEYIKAYPNLKYIRVASDPALKGTTLDGSALAHRNLININPKFEKATPQEIKKILLHEITHMSPQTAENFTPGSSPENAENLIMDYFDKLDGMHDNAGKGSKIIQVNRKAMVDNHPLTGWGNGNSYYDLTNDLEEMAHRVYMATPGEVDARLMEAIGELPGVMAPKNPVGEMGMFGRPDAQLQVPYAKGGLVRMKECNCG